MIYSRFSLVIYFIHCINHVLCEPSELLWRVWGLIQNAILPLLPSSWGFSFALGRGVAFYDGIQHSPVDGCSAASCNLEILQENMSACPSTPPYLLYFISEVKSNFIQAKYLSINNALNFKAFQE